MYIVQINTYENVEIKINIIKWENVIFAALM